MSGRVVLVGAGPGDPDLLTVRALRELQNAQVLLYDALIDPILLGLAPEGCERIDVGKRGDGTRGVLQSEIADLLVSKALAGHDVVRLKGGDPFMFGRGGEEASALRQAGIPFEIVPGISSSVAVPAYAGIPVTDRRVSSSVTVVTGHRGKETNDDRVDWEGLARGAETLVILMGTAWLDDIVARVLSTGRDPQTPAAAIASGATPRQKVVCSPLVDLPKRVRDEGLKAPTTIVIGQVVQFRDELAWFEKRPLFGRRVLVPRSEDQSTGLALELLRRAAQPVVLPLLEFVAAEDEESLAQALAEVSSYDWLVFTSANTVRFCAALLEGRDLSRVAVACIGEATAGAARAAGLRVDVVPSGASLPDELARQIARTGPLRGRKLLYPRAERARERLLTALLGEGAQVDPVVAYRTRMPEGSAAKLHEVVKQGIDAVTFTSPSTVEHFFSTISKTECEALEGQVVFACIGPTTATEVARWSKAEPVIAERQSDEGLVKVLERAFAEGSDAIS
ncbi:MAG: uroporphyrinogen-III C-methyltransferase [bacterium]|nr:uroporphyrinogen-III C-methyltransferase [bacterium]